jgi:hypothetical protein
MPVFEYIRRGSIVTYGRDTKLYQILKENPRNYRAEDETGLQFNLPREHTRLAPADAEFKSVAPPTPTLHLGDTVVFQDHDAVKFPGTYVVIAHTSEGRAKFARLNGGTNETVRGSTHRVRKVTV